MTINNKSLGVSDNPVGTNTGSVLPKLINHNTPESEFQEGLDDVARQVDQNQVDVGYEGDIATARTGAQARTVHARLTTLESTLGVADDGTRTTAGGTGFAVGQDTASDIGGSLGNLEIRSGTVDTDELADSGVTSAKIADDTIMNADINSAAGIERTKLESTIQTFQVTTGTDQAAAQNLGSDITVPIFSQDQDGVVDGPTSSENTPGGGASDALYVLGSDNNWHQLNTFVRHGNTVPAAEVASTATGHVTSAAVPMGTTIADFLAVGANRMEGNPAMTYGLEVGDYINFTNTTPTPPQQSAFVYIGPPLVASPSDNPTLRPTDGAASDFVAIGQAENFGFASGGSIEFATGTRNLQLTSSIAGDRTFAGNTTFTGSTTHNGNVVLGADDSNTVDFNADVVSNIIPDANGTRALGSTTARWDVFADAINATSISGPITDANIADRAIDEGKINPSGSTAAQVLTSTGASTNPEWMDPPIGVEMVDPLPTTGDYPFGVLVSLTATDTSTTPDSPPGIYRRNNSTSPYTWERLGSVGAILSTERIDSTATATYTPNTAVSPAHFITIDGLVLVETVDYTVGSNGTTFTLTSPVGTGRDIVVHNFSDVAMLGTGQVALTALSGGTLPSNVEIPGGQVNSAVAQAASATNATTAGSAASATNNAFQIGGWTIVENAQGGLDFNRGTNTLFRMTSAGHFHADDDITAFSTTI